MWKLSKVIFDRRVKPSKLEPLTKVLIWGFWVDITPTTIRCFLYGAPFIILPYYSIWLQVGYCQEWQLSEDRGSERDRQEVACTTLSIDGGGEHWVFDLICLFKNASQQISCGYLSTTAYHRQQQIIFLYGIGKYLSNPWWPGLRSTLLNY